MISPDSKIHRLPWPLRALVYLAAMATGPFLFLGVLALHSTCRVIEVHKERLPEGGHILACWHGRFVLYICGSGRFPGHAWLHHDGVYLAPGMLAMHLLGVKKLIAVPPGSGREAAKNLAQALRDGHTTFLTPDGPFGPGQVPKSGVFHLSRESARPIVGMTLSCDRVFKWPSWDKKLIPLPFSTIRITYSEPFQVDENNFEEARAWLMEALQTIEVY